MKKFLIVLLVFASAIGCMARGNADRYASRMTRDGTIFFLMPQRLKQLSGIQRFEFDMTCLTWSDTVTVNFTIRSHSMELPDDVCLQNGAIRLPALSTVKLYSDIVRGGHEIRMSSKFLWPGVQKMFTAANPPVYVFSQSGRVCSATYRPGKWKREGKEISSILQLFEYSRK